MVEGELLIGTHRKLIHYLDGKQVVIHEGQGPYFGITWDWDTIYVAARRWDRTGSKEAIYAFDKNLKLVETIELLGGMQLHQLYYWNGWVFITDTMHDRIMAMDRKRNLETVYRASPTNENYHHMNSIWSDGLTYWVAQLKKEQVRRFDLWRNTDKWHHRILDTISVGTGTHNVFVKDGALYACRSERSELFIHRLSDGIWRTELLDIIPGGYMRGLCRTEDRWFVGASLLKERPDRARGDAAIAVFDWVLPGPKKLGTIELVDVGQVHDFRIMDERDYAHHRMFAPGRYSRRVR